MARCTRLRRTRRHLPYAAGISGRAGRRQPSQLPPPPPHAVNKKLKLSFKLPYRCHFGQDICIVGSSEDLGNWDPRRGVGMQWSEGDVWQVEFDVSAG
jgi:hypothetical protein